MSTARILSLNRIVHRHSSSTPTTSSPTSPPAQYQLTKIYTGPMGKATQFLKRVSVASLGLTYAVTPLFTLGSSQGSTAAWFVLGLAVVVSTSSTSLIQWCCNPYVLSISQKPTSNPSNILSNELTVETLGFFGNIKTWTITRDSIKPTKARAFANWTAAAPKQNVAERFFYVHPELEDLSPEMEKLMEVITGEKNKKVKELEEAKNWDDLVENLKKRGGGEGGSSA
ncbi:hypothetical protein HDV05_000173 [Chytridiales sp. JEL 0842]|nr:hypothetical protein HDV05_000173 [Chytridiales sp. JEL 0842]